MSGASRVELQSASEDLLKAARKRSRWGRLSVSDYQPSSETRATCRSLLILEIGNACRISNTATDVSF